jgi:hypothetical protein
MAQQEKVIATTLDDLSPGLELIERKERKNPYKLCSDLRIHTMAPTTEKVSRSTKALIIDSLPRCKHLSIM